MLFKKVLARIVAALCASAILIPMIPVVSFAASATVANTAPKGTSNMTAGATVSVSACSNNRKGSENSYEMPSENWAKAMLFDEDLKTGWSTNPYDKETDVKVPVTLTIKLKKAGEASAVALFPLGMFPKAYTVSISPDGVNYKKVGEETDAPGAPGKPKVYEFSNQKIQYVKIEVTERCNQLTGDGALVQFAEIAIYGKAEIFMNLNYAALEFVPGGSDTIKASFSDKKDRTVTFKSSDESVAKVDAEGRVTAVSIGKATIICECAEAGLTDSCDVYVVNERYTYGQDNIMISIFWPPTKDYITDEQYKLMADAGIDWVMGSGEETLATVENNKKMLALCAKYGMGMTVSDGTFGNSLLSCTHDRIKERVQKYANVAAAEGFYILDEPMNPNQYVDAFVTMKEANPKAYMHLNFLPSSVYGTSETYEAQMNDFCKLIAAKGYSVDYLMYDRYPFGLAAGSIDYAGYLSNLRSAHDVGLKNNVRTANYIQTVCQEVAFRRPLDAEIRYEMYSTLAFGFKQLSFFTWFTPVNRNEPFKDGIIAADGTPNQHYETIKQLDAEIHAIGTTLAKCDALEIYLNGTSHGQPSIPADFFVKPGDKRNYIISLMKHNETGRNYIMIVNNLFSKAQTISLDFDSKVTSLSEVSKVDGSLVPVAMDGSKLTLELEKGDAILLALPEGLDFTKQPSSPKDGDNLALSADILADDSMGSGGWYISYLNDGKRISDSISNGWKTTDDKAHYIEMDFGVERSFNRIDIFAAGSLFDYGTNMPEEVTISISNDGKTFTTVKKVSDLSVENGSVKLESVVSARFLRLDIAKTRGTAAAIGEIEVYNDNGNIPEMPQKMDLFIGDSSAVVEYEEGSDIALNKKTYVSSTTPDSMYKQWGWSQEYLNNGQGTNGWTSGVGRNSNENANEYAIVDLGDVFAVEKVVITDFGKYPADFTIEVSLDGMNWAVFADIKGASDDDSGTKHEYSMDSKYIIGRYVKVNGTKLRSGGNDGYLMQLGNISVYGKPVCDKANLEKVINDYKAAKLSTDVEAFKNAEEGLKNKLLTQSQANKLTSDLAALITDYIEPTFTPMPSEGVTPPSGSSGCFGAVDGSVAACVAAGAVLAAKKKKKKEE